MNNVIVYLLLSVGLQLFMSKVIYAANAERVDRDVTPCSSTPCQNEGQCIFIEQNDLYLCNCKDGFTGIDCETPVSSTDTKVAELCSSEPCQNGGTCRQNGELSLYFCTCVEGYTGRGCETPLKI
ncbi:prostaglandin G/H synthase 2-like [Glandiceps talaboti]